MFNEGFARDFFGMPKRDSLSTPEDREHIAGSLYAVVEALWRARLELMALRGKD